MPLLVQGKYDKTKHVKNTKEQNMSHTSVDASLKKSENYLFQEIRTGVKETNNNNNEASNVTAIDSAKQNTKCQCYCPHHAQFNSEILRQLFFLRSLYTELLDEVKKIKEGPNQDVHGHDEVSILQNFNLPIAAEEGLKELDMFLRQTQNFNRMQSELCKVGGSNLLDFVKRCMGMLIANQLAATFSWLGRRNKMGFKNYEMIVEVIINAAIKTNKCKDKNEAEKEIARWLRRAPDRLK
ncbi:unnamed protein product [Ceutorhynchus assimilis]|uniref:DUF4806 domain-containing protein n=1 Tax=Ceutorhynchus assimilis TaxID=467358 RepID=A0A9P0DJC6_9CUCU|nr:unnamed protein product [Ceutorhynchus assimilis]